MLEPVTASETEQQFNQLRQEWDAALNWTRNSREGRRQIVTQEWEQALQSLVEEQRDLVRKGQWIRGADDMLSVIGQSRRETYHSALIAWLLDPLSRHRMGDAFLKRFLAATGSGPAEAELLIRRVQCEVVCPSGRADIVIFGDNFTVVIENKVDAVESDGQCQQYLDDFGEDPEVSFVFLSPSGRKPISVDPEQSDRYACISYQQILEILDEASPPGSQEEHSAVIEYRKTLKREFS